jgi:hypothetical protein
MLIYVYVEHVDTMRGCFHKFRSKRATPTLKLGKPKFELVAVCPYDQDVVEVAPLSENPILGFHTSTTNDTLLNHYAHSNVCNFRGMLEAHPRTHLNLVDPLTLPRSYILVE